MANFTQFYFSEEKNILLKEDRGISFDDVVFAIENGGLLDTITHTSKKYPHQKIFVVLIDDYVYAVPFVENGDKAFLKTLYPNRQLTKLYLEGKI